MNTLVTGVYSAAVNDDVKNALPKSLFIGENGNVLPKLCLAMLPQPNYDVIGLGTG